MNDINKEDASIRIEEAKTFFNKAQTFLNT